MIRKSKLESLMTNMITIKANAKIYAEEINAKVWDLQDTEKKTKRAELFSETYNMESDTESISKINDPTINDKILTISTCYTDAHHRLVVQAKLIGPA